MGHGGGVTVERWAISSATAQGTSHVSSGTPCQDAVQHHYEPVNGGNVLLIVCADGAGSAARSADGSRWACDEAMIALQTTLREGGVAALSIASVLQAIESARAEIFSRSIDEGVSARDFASTLIVVALTPDTIFVAQIGDGVVVIGQGNDLHIAIEVEQEMLNVTDFLVDTDAMQKVRSWSGPADGITRVAVSTDGLMPVLIDHRKNRPHLPMFSMFFDALQSCADETEVSERLSEFMRSEQVNQRTDDDKSLVLALRKQAT